MRTILNAGDIGIYAYKAWMAPGVPIPPASYFSLTKDLTFAVRSIAVQSDGDAAKLDLSGLRQEVTDGQAYAPRKRVIVRIYFWGGTERTTGPVQNPAVYASRLDAALRQLASVADKLLGVTLAEENIHYAGRPQVLASLYDHVKAAYPSLRVWQWFSPSVYYPGYNGVIVPADGYVIDCYTLCPQRFPDAQFHMGPDPYTWIVEKYLATGRPLIATLFAGATHPEWFDPKANPWGMDVAEVAEHQFQVHLAHDVPTCLYWCDARGGVNLHDPELASSNAMVADYVTRTAAVPVVWPVGG